MPIHHIGQISRDLLPDIGFNGTGCENPNENHAAKSKAEIHISAPCESPKAG